MSKKSRRTLTQREKDLGYRICRCGAVYAPCDPQRNRCMECHLAAREAEAALGREAELKLREQRKGAQGLLSSDDKRTITPTESARLNAGFAMLREAGDMDAKD